ncbi:MAG: hypothetical protein ACI4GW_10255 [Lachnospiraceae bacterium]
MKGICNKIFVYILMVFMCVSCLSVSAYATETESVDLSNETEVDYSVLAANGMQEYTNLVVFVDCSDTVGEHSHSSMDYCFKKEGNADKTFTIFDGTDSQGNATDKRGLKPYLYNISYGAFSLTNVFPQYDSATNTMTSYELPQTSTYYASNPSALAADVMEALDHDANAKNILDTMNVSHRGDGVLDNVMIVVGRGSSTTDPFGGVTFSSGFGSVTSTGGTVYQMGSYNIIPESEAYLGVLGSGLLIHEFMHSIGYPDLYCNTNDVVTPIPVGRWDIMASVSQTVQYPLAYMRQHVSGWLSLPVVTTNQTDYTLTAAAATNDSNKNNQAVILKTPYSDSEVFVIEYRKKQDDYIDSRYSMNYDTRIAGSGIIIYRVSTRLQTNITGAPYMVYIYRQNDTIRQDGYESGNASNVYVDTAFLSAESGRTEYGSDDSAKNVTENAITYSDGTNSGIVIKNVGSATGDTISFDIEFNDLSEAYGGYWEEVAHTSVASGFNEIDSCMDEQGNIYVLASNNSGSSSKINLIKYTKNGTFSTVSTFSMQGSSYHIGYYNNNLYVSYCDYNDGYKGKLSRISGNKLITIHETDEAINNVSMDVASDGIYVLYDDNCTVSSVRYNGITSIDIGSVFGTGDYSNASVTCSGSHVVALARRWQSGNTLVLAEYKNNSWTLLEDTGEKADNATAVMNEHDLYVLLNGKGIGPSSGDYSNNYDDNRVIRGNLASSTVTWSRVGSNAFSNQASPIMDMCFDNGAPYIFYYSQVNSENHTCVMSLDNNTWTPLGTELTNEELHGIDVYSYDKNVYVLYGTGNGNIYLKKHKVSDQNTQLPENPTPEKISLSNCIIDSITEKTYTGKAIKPSVIVKYNGTTLTKDVDYTITYSNNVSPGTATVKLTGIGNYEGTKSATFTILAKKTSTTVYNGVDYSAVYDYNYYVTHHKDIWKVYGLDDTGALAHFVNYGMKEGRQGCEEFNVTYYKNRYVDLRNAFGKNLLLYYKHYMTSGKKEGRDGKKACTSIVGSVTKLNGVDYSAVYNYTYYLNKYGDIMKAYNGDDIAALTHFVNYGMKEGRQGCANFNVTSYAYKYYDLRKSYKNDKKKYYTHYMNYGRKEGRIATGTTTMQGGPVSYSGVNYSAVFNVGYYANKYADLRKVYGFDDVAYLKHFVNYGMKEGRQGSSDFNVNSYKNRYKDLQKAYGNDLMKYYLHYINYGKKEGRKGN